MNHKKPLDGIKVIEISTIITASFSAMMSVTCAGDTRLKQNYVMHTLSDGVTRISTASFGQCHLVAAWTWRVSTETVLAVKASGK